MKLLTLPLFAALATTAAAQSQWRFGAGYAPMIGLKTEFSGFGNFTNLFPVATPAPGTDYFYLDGSVQVDVSGNFGGLTSFWSYNNASQIDPAAFGGQGAVNYSTLSSSLTQAGKVSDSGVSAPASFEVFGYRDLGSVSISGVADRKGAWGVRVGLQYARVDQTNNDRVTAEMTTITDSYNLNGVIPPLAPFTGAFDGGFGVPLLSDTPVRTLGTTTAAISGSRRLDVHLSVAQFGSYLNIPVSKDFDVMIEGGVLAGLASGTYDYTTTVAVPGVGTQTTTGRNSENKLLPGFYTGLGVNGSINPRLSVQASARYQYMTEFDLNANGSNANLNFDSAFVLSLAVIWKF
jgi:hypothetical protein